MNKYFVVILNEKLKYKFNEYGIEMYISRRTKHVQLVLNSLLASFDYEWLIIDFLQKEWDKLDWLELYFISYKSPQLIHGIRWKLDDIIFRNIINNEC